MSNLRFSIRQTLLLTMLVALIAGLYSTAIRQPANNEYCAVCVSPDGNHLAVFGTQGVDVFDLEQGQMVDEVRWLGSVFNNGAFGMLSNTSIEFLDNESFAFERISLGNAGIHAVSKYSLRDRELNDVIEIPFTSLGNGGMFGKYQMSRDVSLQTVEVTDIQTEEKLSNKKFLAPLESNSGMSPDGKYVYFHQRDLSDVGLIIEPMKTQVWDRVDARSLGEIDAYAVSVAFSPDGKHVVAEEEATLRCFDVVESTDDETDKSILEFQEKWTLEIKGGAESIEFSNDGEFVAARSRAGGGEIISVETGAPVVSLEQDDLRLIQITPDAKQYVLIPMSSDSPFEVRDAKDGSLVRKFGGNWRTTKALLYCGLLFLWPFIWAFVSIRKRKRIAPESEKYVPDPFQESTVVEDSEIEIIAEAVSSKKPWTIRAVWTLMIIGGFFSILWSAIPMFYFENGYVGNLTGPALLFFRFALAGWGVLVGLLASSRGIGRSHNLLMLTAILQILCIVGLDVFNFGMGIANIAFLNQPSTKKYLSENQFETN